jgi:hypothetical protein
LPTIWRAAAADAENVMRLNRSGLLAVGAASRPIVDKSTPTASGQNLDPMTSGPNQRPTTHLFCRSELVREGGMPDTPRQSRSPQVVSYRSRRPWIVRRLCRSELVREGGTPDTPRQSGSPTSCLLQTPSPWGSCVGSVGANLFARAACLTPRASPARQQVVSYRCRSRYGTTLAHPLSRITNF